MTRGKKAEEKGQRYVCSICECRVKMGPCYTSAALRGGLERQWHRKSSSRAELQKMHLVMHSAWNQKWLKVKLDVDVRPR